MNQNTYTYTARNVEDPDKVVTFTLFDDRMRINLTGLLEQAQDIVSSDGDSDELKHKAKIQAKPVLLKIKERISGPVHVSDVKARLEEDEFAVTMWPRVGGLRLAPVKIDMGEVDNEDAAEAFVDELEERKDMETDKRKFLGPLDYWFGWAGLLLLVGILIRRPSSSEA